jgi:hypothetical protein
MKLVFLKIVLISRSLAGNVNYYVEESVQKVFSI